MHFFITFHVWHLDLLYSPSIPDLIPLYLVGTPHRDIIHQHPPYNVSSTWFLDLSIRIKFKFIRYPQCTRNTNNVRSFERAT